MIYKKHYTFRRIAQNYFFFEKQPDSEKSVKDVSHET